MKEMIIRVPEDSVAFVGELVERIGGDIKTPQLIARKNKNKTKEKKPLPTDFFGKFPDLDLDPVTYRDALWKRKEY